MKPPERIPVRRPALSLDPVQRFEGLDHVVACSALGPWPPSRRPRARPAGPPGAPQVAIDAQACARVVDDGV